jgi:hypothetical protein
VGVKTCSRCRESKPLDDFHNQRASRSGKQSYCKACHQVVRLSEKPPSIRRRRRAFLKSRFGISLEQYDTLLAAQGGTCAICRNPETVLDKGVPRALSVDHDHETGKVRGLLCGGCNQGLGRFRDSPVVLKRAVVYLEGWE